MSTAQRYQLDLQYKGRSGSIIVAPMLEGSGWGWAALIDQTQAIEHKGRAFKTPELAMADGKANVEAYVDSCCVA
ncbi:hypothetical protein ACFJGW_01865 [Burkholderiaceae bacterium UC74_6]